MKHVLVCCFVAVSAFFVVPVVNGQVLTGTPQYGSFTSGPDVINLGNLNSHFSVPVFSKPGRGMPFNYALTFDNSVWYPSSASGTSTWTPVFNWGWEAQTPVVTGELTYSTASTKCYDQPPGFYYGQRYNHFVYYDTFGTVHQFNLTYTSCATDPGPHSVTAQDGSGLTFDGASTITTPKGQVFSPPINTVAASATVTDSNGNQISAGSTSFTDTLGMTALSVSGSGTPSSPITLTYTDSSGTARSVTINYVAATVKTNFGCSGISEYGPTSNNLVSSISLADGTSYSFTYEPTPGATGDVTGRIQSITLPTGGTITYAYTGGNNGIECADGSTAGISRTTSDGTTTYSRSGSGTAWTTTVTDAQSNQTVINFQTATATGTVSPNFYETHRTINQGSSTVLAQTDTCYNGTTPNCSSAAITLPVTEVKSYSTLNNNQQSLVDTILDSTLLLTKEVDEYDFGSGAPGALLRKTLTTYASLGSVIVGLPATVTVCGPGGTATACGGSGTVVAATNYNYDETAVSATSGVPQHIAVSGNRGNLTTLAPWLSTTNSTLKATFTYDDTGNVLTSTDPGGHQTNFSYADSFSDGINRNSLAYVTQVTLPATSVAHVTKAQYNPSTGLPTKTWDQNNNATTYAYDLLLRPSGINFPDGGQTNFFYPDPNDVEQKRLISGTTYDDYKVKLDGLGRPYQTQFATPDCSGNIKVDTTYDSLGRVASTSNAYCVTTDPTYGVTSYQYDALGRITQVTRPDGTTLLNSYTGRATKTQDEGNGNSRVTRIAQSDGLGRLVAVCEVTGATQSGSYAPSSCNLDIAGTGFLTTYQNDTLNDLTGVQQNASARSFAYDSLRRLLSLTNPESGTTSYTYDNNGNVLTRTRPAPNQANPQTLLTTSYQYDALNRLTQISYSDGVTPTITRNYDTSSELGVTLANTVGRLSAVYAKDAQANLLSGKVYSYDQMGRIKDNSQCTPQNCSKGTAFPVSYSYDLLGNRLTATNGAGVTFSYNYDAASRLTQMTSSLADSNHPGTLVSGLQYNALGALTAASAGNALNEGIKWDCRGRILGYASAIAPAMPSQSMANTAGCPNTTAMNTRPGQPDIMGPLFRLARLTGFEPVKQWDWSPPPSIPLAPGRINPSWMGGQ